MLIHFGASEDGILRCVLRYHSYVLFLFRIVETTATDPMRNRTTNVLKSYSSLTDFRSPRAPPACRGNINNDH